jgi:hypothetical protein
MLLVGVLTFLVLAVSAAVASLRLFMDHQFLIGVHAVLEKSATLTARWDRKFNPPPKIAQTPAAEQEPAAEPASPPSTPQPLRVKPLPPQPSVTRADNARERHDRVTRIYRPLPPVHRSEAQSLVRVSATPRDTVTSKESGEASAGAPLRLSDVVQFAAVSGKPDTKWLDRHPEAWDWLNTLEEVRVIPNKERPHYTYVPVPRPGMQNEFESVRENSPGLRLFVFEIPDTWSQQQLEQQLTKWTAGSGISPQEIHRWSAPLSGEFSPKPGCVVGGVCLLLAQNGAVPIP